MEKQRVTAIKTEENREVMTEDLLMKLALTETVLKEMADYIAAIEGFISTDCPDSIQPPDGWAVSGAIQNINGVSHALKCACWGYQEAFKH